MWTRLKLCGVGMLLLGSAVAPAVRADGDEVARLQREVALLRERLEALERRLDAGSDAPGAADGFPIRMGLDLQEAEGLATAVIGAERIEEARIAAAPEPPPIRLGGALRFNHFFREDVQASRTRRGDSGFDLFRLNADGEIRDILLSVEYRYTPDLSVIRHGWLGYRFADDSLLKLGIHRVPFGLLPFAAHNFWDGVPFYAGFADNHDLGLAYVRRDGPWDLHLAFYKNEELGNAASLARYAPDLVLDGSGRHEEINRFNARIAHTFGRETGCEHELGVSGQHADLVNADTGGRGRHWAAAAHVDSRCGRWNLQLQGARYVYDPDVAAGPRPDSVRLGAFGTSFDLAAEGRLLVANLAYNFDVPARRLDQVICYNNYSRLLKDAGDGRDSELNTLGCGVGAGPLFAYFDLILARNMVFFGQGSMAAGGEDRWRSRFNINLGYYW